MSTLNLNNMPKKNADPIKSGRIKSQRTKTKFCKTLGCTYFTKDTHCSGCKSGLPKKKANFRKKLGSVVNIMTMHSHGVVGDTILDTLRNLRRSEKPVLFKAKDVAKLFHGDYNFSSRSYHPVLMSPADKILIRVVDYWNLHRNNGFHSAIQCYWNRDYFDYYSSIEDNLYHMREKLFDKESLKKVLGPSHGLFELLWKQLLSSKGPIPTPVCAELI